MQDNLEFIGQVKFGGNQPKDPANIKYWEYWISNDGKLFKGRSDTDTLVEVNMALTSNNTYKGTQYGGYYAAPTNKLPEKYIHRMVASAFVHNDDPATKTCVDHIDGDKHNNHYTNLEWVTRSENHKRMHARLRAEGVQWTGRIPRL